MGDRRELLNDPEEALRLALDGRQSSIWTAMPCIITSVNFSKMTCEAQPAIQGTVTKEDGTQQSVNLPLLVDVPIVFPSAGGFTITLPLKAGDEVLVVFASRCIDAWWQSSGINRAAEARMHDLSDGFAIPGPKSVPKAATIPAISSTGAQIRNDAGTTYIEVSADGKIKLVSPTGIAVTGNLTVTGSVEATLDVKAGTLTPLTTRSVLTHTHISAAPGNPTGPPLP